MKSFDSVFLSLLFLASMLPDAIDELGKLGFKRSEKPGYAECIPCGWETELQNNAVLHAAKHGASLELCKHRAGN